MSKTERNTMETHQDTARAAVSKSSLSPLGNQFLKGFQLTTSKSINLFLADPEN